MFYLKKIEDILQAAIQDAGLDANMQMHSGCITNNINSCSSSHSNNNQNETSSQFSSNYYTNSDANQNAELLLGDLDFNLLGNDSSSYSISNNNPTSTHSMLTDDNDPFLVALKQLDEHNSKIKCEEVEKKEEGESNAKTDYDANHFNNTNNNDMYKNNYKTSNNSVTYAQSNTSSEANFQPRKIIKLNLPNHGTISSNQTSGLMTQTLTSIKTPQPLVRVFSSSSQQNTSSVTPNANKSNSNDLIR